jgi:hypothetical protein
MLLACSYPRMAPIYFGIKDDEHLHTTYSVVGLLTPMNHSLHETTVSSAYEGDRTLKWTPTVRWCQKG